MPDFIYTQAEIDTLLSELAARVVALESGTPVDAYSKAESDTLVATEAAARSNGDTVLSQRIQTLVDRVNVLESAPPGGSTGNAGIVDVRGFRAGISGGRDITAPLLGALNDAWTAGVVPFIPAMTAYISAPLPVRGRVVGAGWKRTNLIGKGIPTGRGIFEAFTDTTTVEHLGLAVQGTTGNGFVTREAFSNVYDCWIDGGTGRGELDGHAVALRPGTVTSVNVTVKRVRLSGANSRIWQESGNTPTGQPIFTDWIFEDIICLADAATLGPVPDIYMKNSGGGQIRHVHTNGSGGDGIRIQNAYQLTIDNLYMDGWGVSSTAATDHCAIRIDNLVSGGVVNIGKVNMDRRGKGVRTIYVDNSTTYPVHIGSVIGEPGGGLRGMELPSSAQVGLVSGLI